MFAWGTNGFLILKNGNSLTDESTNTNNFTLGAGTLTNTLDCPSDVFATLNPLVNNNVNPDQVFSNGNNYVATGGGGSCPQVSTLGMTTGKFYAEFKKVSGSGGNQLFGVNRIFK